MILLGVNIDHVATLRQARGTRYPSPIEAALRAETAGVVAAALLALGAGEWGFALDSRQDG